MGATPEQLKNTKAGADRSFPTRSAREDGSDPNYVTMGGKKILVRGGSSIDSPKEEHNPGNPGHKRPFAVSASYDVYGGRSGEGKSGVIGSQSESRTSLPPVDNNVPAAKAEEGTAVRCARQQTGENRYPINSHEESHKTHGPNN